MNLPLTLIALLHKYWPPCKSPYLGLIPNCNRKKAKKIPDVPPIKLTDRYIYSRQIAVALV